MKTRQDAAMKIIKLLNLYNNSGASIGEKDNAASKIKQFCEEHRFRISGNMLIDIDVENKNKERKFDELNSKPKPQYQEEEFYNPYKTNAYVLYKGVKYYKQPGKGPPVPKHVYTKTYLGGNW